MSKYRTKKKHTKNTSIKKKAFISIAVILGLAVAVGLGGIVFLNFTLNHINRAESTKAIPRSEQDFERDGDEPDTISPEDVIWDGTDVEVMKDTDIRNILLIGQDRREGQGRQRSDTMIICSINKRTDKIILVSLMRDMYVPIPGYDDNRINAAYAFGGMKLLDQTIEEDFGIHIDGNVEVDFEGFIKSMSRVGNLEIELTKEEADYINKNLKRGSLKAGRNMMDPEQVLMYARIRKVGNADYQRTERQRIVLQTAFAKLRQSDLRTIINVANDILPNFTTDLTNRQIMGYIYTVVVRNMSISRDTFRLPIDGSFASERIRGMAVLVPDLERNREALVYYLYGIGQ